MQLKFPFFPMQRSLTMLQGESIKFMVFFNLDIQNIVHMGVNMFAALINCAIKRKSSMQDKRRRQNERLMPMQNHFHSCIKCKSFVRHVLFALDAKTHINVLVIRSMELFTGWLLKFVIIDAASTNLAFEFILQLHQ